MRLSANFTLAELTVSVTARARGIDNSPPPEVLPRLIQLAQMLERIRTLTGGPVSVSSGYRGRALNTAIGGAAKSDHLNGDAADIYAAGHSPMSLARLLQTKADDIGIGQLILETPPGRNGWVHVSTREPSNPANRFLTFDGKGYMPGLHAVG